MFKQFNVYRNPSLSTNKHLPYYIIIQDDCHEDLSTRVIIPLMRSRKIPIWHGHLAPEVNIDFDRLLIYAPMITNINNAKINEKDFVCNLRHARQDVIAAIDCLLTNT